MYIKYICITLLLGALSVKAQTVIERPTVERATAFAIVTDNNTYQQTQPAMLHYRDAVQQDGLAVYIVRGDWQTPDEVKKEIIRLYEECPLLEGMVLVGDIPVAMIRNAQHLTTAFKMNEKTFPFQESSVPSDRFYDDLNLKFEFIARDSVELHCFYYKLAEESPQTLNPTFYSARIKYPEAKGGDKYAAIAAFLEKAANAKEQMATDRLDQVVSFNGGSYNSDCLIAWMDEEKAYRENFPLAFSTGTNFKHWNFRMKQPMKYRIFDELQRKEVDLFMFHEHGTPTTQLINNEPEGITFDSRYQLVKSKIYSNIQKALNKGADEDSLKQVYAQKYHLTDTFFKDLHNATYWREDSISHADTYITVEDLSAINTYPKVVMFDACYNGSFHEKEYVAGYYLFNQGETLVAQGNTRNVLQDRWTIEMIGLLSHGMRVGQYNRLVATLEGHLLGDPTVHFAPIEKNALTTDVTLHRSDQSYWEECFKAPYADIQCLALRMWVDADSKKELSSMLLKVYKESGFNTVRMEAIKLLSRYNNDDFKKAVKMGLNDSYERIARLCADYAGKIGDPSLLPDMIRALVDGNERTRVQYTLHNSLILFQQTDVEEAIDAYYRQANRVDAEQEKEKILHALDQQFKNIILSNRRIENREESDTKRIASVRMLRNNPYHPYLSSYLQVLQRVDDSLDVRVAMAEALGWFNYSIRRNEIIDVCRQMLLQSELPDELAKELRQTLNRLVI